MKYSADNINFDLISPTEFERLCFELLLKLGYSEVTWRQGGADNGRDIEATLNFLTPLTRKKTKWFIECKHYTTGGVPPEHLNSKIAWADAERPDFLIFIMSSYPTTQGREWLEKLKHQKPYTIIVIDGQDLKNRLLSFTDLIERFFSVDRYEKLFLEIKNHSLHYKIQPSYDALSEIISNIDTERLTIHDIGFLLISLYKNYLLIEIRNDYFGDVNPNLADPLFEKLVSLSSNDTLPLLADLNWDFSFLDSNGCIEEATDEINSETNFQFCTLHLNTNKTDEHWALGYYLFIKTENHGVFEVFSIDNSEFRTCTRFFGEYKPSILSKLSIDFGTDIEKILTERNSTFKK
nr:restriction endonuclease [uncultured Flavobacterium sp.]